jgi:hypothetical protein
MLALRLQNSEEQIKRDRSLAATRSQLTDLGIETAHQACSTGCACRSTAGSRGCSSQSPPPIRGVRAGRPRRRRGNPSRRKATVGRARARAEIAEIRRELELEDEEPLAPAVAALLKKDDPSWEEWAQRMHALVTNSFSLARTKEELQYALEESLMAVSRQTKIARKLEVLRFEKKLLVGNRLPSRSQRKAPTFIAVLPVVAPVRKLQKLTGSVACTQI